MRKAKKLLCAVVFLFAIAFVCQAHTGFCGAQIEGKVNINTATEDQISILPGVGPKLASEVVNYRKINGDFKEVEEIKNVNGVGDKKFEKMKDFIAVEGDTTITSTKVAKGEKVKKGDMK
ncbi:MAG: hypothetical protein B6D35_10870 [Candidatus Brocadia sp. UTAMX2]|jgi:competence protein ComEA|nr:MAG: hypothetical protein B6D35_10870 [Candidatus Brocadia sp. UTAMX2]